MTMLPVLSVECPPLTYNLNGFKYRVKRHLFISGFFLIIAILYAFLVFLFLFLVISYLIAAVLPYVELISIIQKGKEDKFVTQKCKIPILNTNSWCPSGSESPSKILPHMTLSVHGAIQSPYILLQKLFCTYDTPL